MNELLAKLTNLAYDLFSVLIPGLILGLFVLLWWHALGELPPIWTRAAIPELTVATVQGIIQSLNAASGIGIAVPAIAFCYFAGHVLLWVSRSGKHAVSPTSPPWWRAWLCVTLRVPKLENNFDPKLKRLYDEVAKKFASGSEPLEWREFYPVVKSYVAQRISNSLVSTYQNKYTLHRSITAAGTLLFWVSLASILLAMLTPALVPLSTYVYLALLAVAGLFLVWYFSSSYLYYWGMFGNAIITEAYSKFYGPPDEPKKQQ